MEKCSLRYKVHFILFFLLFDASKNESRRELSDEEKKLSSKLQSVLIDLNFSRDEDEGCAFAPLEVICREEPPDIRAKAVQGERPLVIVLDGCRGWPGPPAKPAMNVGAAREERNYDEGHHERRELWRNER